MTDSILATLEDIENDIWRQIPDKQAKIFIKTKIAKRDIFRRYTLFRKHLKALKFKSESFYEVKNGCFVIDFGEAVYNFKIEELFRVYARFLIPCEEEETDINERSTLLQETLKTFIQDVGPFGWMTYASLLREVKRDVERAYSDKPDYLDRLYLLETQKHLIL